MSVIYVWIVGHLTQEERVKFDMELTKPVKGASDAMTAEEELDQLNYL